MNDCPAGKVQGARVSDPSANAPDPVTQWVRYQSRPEKREQQETAEFHAFREGAGNERGGDDRESELEDANAW